MSKRACGSRSPNVQLNSLSPPAAIGFLGYLWPKLGVQMSSVKNFPLALHHTTAVQWVLLGE